MKQPLQSTLQRTSTLYKRFKKKGKDNGASSRKQPQVNCQASHGTSHSSGAPSAELFSGAYLENNGGSVVNNVIFGHRDRFDVDLKLLLPLVVDNAMHTGEVRADPLRCDPNTRQAIHLDILLWIENECREKGILWIFGPAGIGKSAIAMTTAEKLDHHNSRAKVAGSFFFFRNDAKRNTLHYLVPTLAYQLAIWKEEVGREIEHVIKRNPKILEATIETQWKALIVEPVNSATGFPPSVIVIDGLDECGSAKEQRRILDLLSSYGSNFPLAILVTSRPEPPIVNTFNSEPLLSLCRPKIDLACHKEYQEMHKFIRSGFSKIYSRRQDVLQSYAENGTWPSEEAIDLIASRADGQYIYPVTLFKYIDDDDGLPHLKLQACLEQAPEALSPLDTLYMQILRSSHKPEDNSIQNLLFLVSIVTPSRPLRAMPFGLYTDLPENSRSICTIEIPIYVSINFLALFLFSDLDNAQCRFALRKLHAVLDIPSKDEWKATMTIHHQSFMDFLRDHRRSGSYHIDKTARSSEVIKRCLTQLDRMEGIHAPEFFRTLIYIWWHCSAYLPYITADLALQLEQFDFDLCLKRMLECVYNTKSRMDLIKSCNTWEKPSLIAKFNRSAFGCASFASWLHQCYSCFWQGCDHYWSGICLNCFSHDGDSPLTWSTLLVLSKIYAGYRVGAKEFGLKKVSTWLLTTDASDIVLPSLAMFTSFENLRKLPDDDAQYLHCWSRAWAVCEGKDRFRDDEWAQKLRDTILALMQRLPKGHHYHELNGTNVVLWLKLSLNRFSDSQAASEVLAHWEGGECCSPEVAALA